MLAAAKPGFQKDRVTHNRIQLPPVLIARTAYHNLLQQFTGIPVGLDGALEILSIVQQDCSVRLLQGARKHRLLVFFPPLPRARGGALVAVVQPATSVAFASIPCVLLFRKGSLVSCTLWRRRWWWWPLRQVSRCCRRWLSPCRRPRAARGSRVPCLRLQNANWRRAKRRPS